MQRFIAKWVVVQGQIRKHVQVGPFSDHNKPSEQSAIVRDAVYRQHRSPLKIAYTIHKGTVKIDGMPNVNLTVNLDGQRRRGRSAVIIKQFEYQTSVFRRLESSGYVPSSAILMLHRVLILLTQ